MQIEFHSSCDSPSFESIRTISFTAERTVIPARELVSVTAVNERFEPIRTVSSEPSTCPYVPNETVNMKKRYYSHFTTGRIVELFCSDIN